MSVKDEKWKADSVQLIDYSTVIFGLARLPEFCGKDFFVTKICAYNPSADNNSSQMLAINIVF